MPKVRQNSVRTVNGDWAEVMISTSPSARAVAMATCVSIGTCWTGGFWKWNSNTRSAWAMPCSTSPLRIFW